MTQFVCLPPEFDPVSDEPRVRVRVLACFVTDRGWSGLDEHHREDAGLEVGAYTVCNPAERGDVALGRTVQSPFFLEVARKRGEHLVFAVPVE